MLVLSPGHMAPHRSGSDRQDPLQPSVLTWINRSTWGSRRIPDSEGLFRTPLKGASVRRAIEKQTFR